MRFLLHIVRNGKPEIWTYDNFDNAINDAHLTNNQPIVLPFSPSHNHHKITNNVNLLEIMLGAKCNYNCEYCSQKLVRSSFYSASPNDVLPLVDKLHSVKCKEIQLWGGEPLVYIKVLYKLIPQLRAIFPNQTIRFPTNGSLLTKSLIDFFAEYNVGFWISHDGKSTHGKNIFDNPQVKEAIDYAYSIMPDKVSFKATFSRGNCNSESIINFFKPYKSSLNNIAVSYSEHNDCSISNEDALELEQSLFTSFNSRNIDRDSLALREYFARCIACGLNQNQIRGECYSPIGETLTIDMKGRILQCHNFPSVIGQLGSECMPLGFTSFHNRKKCKDCLVVHLCMGGCPGLSDRLHEQACKNYYALYYAYFKAIFCTLFGVYLTKVEKDE